MVSNTNRPPKPLYVALVAALVWAVLAVVSVWYEDGKDDNDFTSLHYGAPR